MTITRWRCHCYSQWKRVVGDCVTHPMTSSTHNSQGNYLPDQSLQPSHYGLLYYDSGKPPQHLPAVRCCFRLTGHVLPDRGRATLSSCSSCIGVHEVHMMYNTLYRTPRAMVKPAQTRQILHSSGELSVSQSLAVVGAPHSPA